MVSAFSLAGQTAAQLPQPVQSSGLICIVNSIPDACFPFAFLVCRPAGAAAASSSVSR